MNSLASLDTLVQLPSKELKGWSKIREKPVLDLLAKPVFDTVSDLKKKAIRLHQTYNLIWPLIDLNSPLENQYWQSYHCCRELKQEGVYLRAKYCNKRWCFECNAIRCAKMINSYMPILKQFKHAQFVTLTRPNVTAEQLPGEIDDLILTWRRLDNYVRCQKKRNIKGIRKLEVTYNWRENTYHPHFHLIVDSPGSAREIINEWLLRNPEASEVAQHFREVDSNSFIELFKYATKIVTDNDMSIYAKDIIFQALVKKRIYQPFGINKSEKISEDPKEVTQAYGMLNPEVYKVWYFNNNKEDWDSLEGESLINTLLKFDTS